MRVCSIVQGRLGHKLGSPIFCLAIPIVVTPWPSCWTLNYRQPKPSHRLTDCYRDRSLRLGVGTVARKTRILPCHLY